MNYLNDACKWAFPHSEPIHIFGAVVSGVISYAVEAGLRDERIGKVVTGIGFIGSGCFMAAKGIEGKIENKTTRNIAIGGGLASVAFGVYSLVDGILDLMNPNLPLERYRFARSCSYYDYYERDLTNISSNGCVNADADPDSIAISKIYIPTSQIGNNFGNCDPTNPLMNLNKLDTPYVKFDDGSKITGRWELSGGGCTTMSLDLADRVNTECPLHNSTTTQIINCFDRLASHYNTSNQIFRDRQCAFNTISVSPKAFDPARSKIEALVSYHSFTVEQMIPSEPVRPEIDHICGEPLEQFIKDVNKVPDGTYLVRTLQLNNNKKLESRGHSMTLFKTEKGSIFYNPSYGFQGFLNCELGEKLAQSLQEDWKNWGVTYPRLYRLQK